MMSMLASMKSDNSFSQFEIIWSKLWFSLFLAWWLSYSKRTQRVYCASGNVFSLRGLYTLVTEGPIFFWEVLGFDIGEVIRFCHNQNWPLKTKWPRFNSTGSCQTIFSLQVGWKSSMPYLGRFLGAQLFGAISAQVHFSFVFNKCDF